MHDIRACLAKLNEKLNPDDFQMLFDRMSEVLIANQKYKILTDLLLNTDKIKVDLSASYFNSILSQILNSKNEFESLDSLLEIIKKFNYSSSDNLVNEQSLNCLNNYSFEEIKKLNEYLYRNKKENSSTALITEDANVLFLKKIIYSMQVNSFLIDFHQLVSFNKKNISSLIETKILFEA